MSTTPRTDAALLSSDCACNCGHTFKLLSEEKYDQGKCVYTGPDIANGNDNVVVLADFARELETELAAAQQEAAHYMSVAQKATDELARLRADNVAAHQMACAAGLERDQLRAEVKRWQAEAEEMSAQRSHNANQAGRLRSELAVAENWVEHHSKHADDLIGENVKLRADLERFTGHGLLDCHAICDQRDAAVAERDRLRAEVERLKGALALGQENCDAIYNDMREERTELTARAERAEAEVERLTKQIKDDNRSYGCELRDPNGTIWEQAAKDHARAERAEADLKQTQSSALTWARFAAEKADGEDVAKQRAERAEASLAFIAKNGGTTHETECGPIACNGSWCAEQARAALAATKEGA